MSQSPDILIIAVIRNPENPGDLKQYLGDKVVAIQGDMTEVDSFPVKIIETWRFLKGNTNKFSGNCEKSLGIGRWKG